MDWQSAFDIAFAIAGFLGGVMLKAVMSTLKELREKDDLIAKDVKDLAVSLPMNYTHKDDFRGLIEILHRIEDKIDRKQDK